MLNINSLTQENNNKNKERDSKSFLTKAEEKSHQLEQRKNEKKAQLFEILMDNNPIKSSKYNANLSNISFFQNEENALTKNFQSNNSVIRVKHEIRSIMNTFDNENSSINTSNYHLRDLDKDGKSRLIKKIQDKNSNLGKINLISSPSIKLTDPMSLISISKSNTNKNFLNSHINREDEEYKKSFNIRGDKEKFTQLNRYNNY